MDKLTKAYRLNTLTSDELQTLKEQINNMSDEELASVIYNDWENDDVQTEGIDNKEIAHIKQTIEAQIHKNAQRFTLTKFIQIAASVLLPVFIISTFYLYKENNAILSDTMIVKTGKGERASIILPDSTEVTMNYNSIITYIPMLYSKERKIQFDGEGYFKVSKDKKHPFIINTKGLQVNVLGTTFNLLARSNDTIAELTLEKGSVQLISLQTGEKVLLAPDQKAILNHKTQCFTIINNNNIRNSIPWRKGDLVFRNEKLGTVLKIIEENYNYSITMDSNYLEDIFTGTLPSSDINEVLEVLEKLYHLKAVIKGHEIQLHTEH